MNRNFIEFILGNIFSDNIPVFDTFFNSYGVRILPSKGFNENYELSVMCDYPLELSWIFNITLNIYHDEINEKNTYQLLRYMANEANYYLSIKYPKQAVFISILNIAECWFIKKFPNKSKIIVKEDWGSDVLFD